MQVVATGNPFDGIALFGPFANENTRDRFCDGCNDTWWIIEVFQPFKTGGLEYILESMDGPLFREQREWLARQDCNEARGLTELLDQIADYAHDCLGVDCLLDGEE